MRKVILAVVSAIVMAAGLTAPIDAASARPRHDYDRDRYYYRHHHHPQPRLVCRTVYERRIVWRHHRRIVVVTPVRRCYWRRW